MCVRLMGSESIVVKAFCFAYDAHLGAYRKGTEIPYIVHPLDVASILMKNGASEMVVVAGLLHDVVEDASVDLEEIKNIFGREVAELVKGASEPEEMRAAPPIDEKKTWTERKQHTIETITEAGFELKLLSCADKLSNIRDMINSINRIGEAFWDRLNAPKEQQAGYYQSMVEAYKTGPENITDTPAFDQFQECVKILFP